MKISVVLLTIFIVSAYGFKLEKLPRKFVQSWCDIACEKCDKKAEKDDLDLVNEWCDLKCWMCYTPLPTRVTPRVVERKDESTIKIEEIETSTVEQYQESTREKEKSIEKNWKSFLKKLTKVKNHTEATRCNCDGILLFLFM